MNYTQEDIENFKQAGKIAGKVKLWGAKLIKPGARMVDVLEQIDQKIYELGGRHAFPPQSSINNCAAHFAPRKEDPIEYKEGDVIKLDIGVHINGCVTDNALTIDLGYNPKLSKAAKDALDNAIKILKPGVQMGEIGAIIENTITDAGFKPIKNLSGHGVGKFIVHKEPTVPNFDNGDTTELKEGDTIALEPFATDGAGMIYETGEAELFMLKGKKPVRSAYTKELIDIVNKKYDGLPFATRLLQKDMSMPKINFALKELQNLGMLRQFPPLMEKNKGIVAQFEHCVLITEKGHKILTQGDD